MTSRDYLSIDRFLTTEVGARALELALKRGLIDLLLSGPCAGDDVAAGNPRGRRILLGLLHANGVITNQDGNISLTAEFRAALRYRDLLEAKIEMLGMIARDAGSLFGCLIEDLPAFMRQSATFELFRYDKCFEETAANMAAARNWMRLTTALTRYEGPVLAQYAGLGDTKHLLDVGGNSGELAMQLRAVFPCLAVTIFDLPLVCRIGREHVAACGETGQIRFVPGDMRRDELPGPVDAVTFKSVLHDWPDEAAAGLIGKAWRALRPGGRIFIFERNATLPRDSLAYHQLQNLVFLHFFRDGQFYTGVLRDLGFHDIRLETIYLDTGFHLVSGMKPAPF